VSERAGGGGTVKGDFIHVLSATAFRFMMPRVLLPLSMWHVKLSIPKIFRIAGSLRNSQSAILFIVIKARAKFLKDRTRAATLARPAKIKAHERLSAVQLGANDCGGH